MSPIALLCWDSSTPYTKSNIHIIAEDKETLQFASGVKVIINSYGQEELWVLTNRLQKSRTGTMNLNEINFRVQASGINQLLGGTKCRSKSGPVNYYNVNTNNNPFYNFFSKFRFGDE